MLKILIADDHPLVRSGIKATLSPSPEFEVVAEAYNFEEALQLLSEHSPDLLLLDVEMPGGRVESMAVTAREMLPDLKILILSGHAEASTIRALMKAQISGYILKDQAPEHLLQAVRVVAGGATWFSQEVMTKMMQQPEEDALLTTLTPRETQILRLLAEGKDNSTIAQEAFLAEQTVRNIVSTIYSKLNVAGRVEAVVLVRDRGLFPEDSSV